MQALARIVGSKGRFALWLLVAFVVWQAVAFFCLPLYADILLPVAALAGKACYGDALSFRDAYPRVAWTLELASGPCKGSVALRLLTYNLGLYLALWAALPRRRAVHLAGGVAALFVFQACDLLLAVESRGLTCLGIDGLDPWALLIKFAHNFSVMGFKAAFPVLLLAGQWYLDYRRDPESRGLHGA